MNNRQINQVLRAHARWLRSDGSEGERANLQGADLRGADLPRADLRSADLRRADLRKANLQGADLAGAYLRGANLRGANLRGANLQRANLQEANLSGANLWEANLTDANFTGADLRYAKLGEWRVWQIGPIGSRRDYLCIIQSPTGEITARTGCWQGTLDELETEVMKVHGDNQYAREYLAVIACLRTLSRATEAQSG